MECFPTLGSGPFWDHLKCILGRGRLRSRQYLMGQFWWTKNIEVLKVSSRSYMQSNCIVIRSHKQTTTNHLVWRNMITFTYITGRCWSNSVLQPGCGLPELMSAIVCWYHKLQKNMYNKWTWLCCCILRTAPVSTFLFKPAVESFHIWHIETLDSRLAQACGQKNRFDIQSCITF